MKPMTISFVYYSDETRNMNMAAAAVAYTILCAFLDDHNFASAFNERAHQSYQIIVRTWIRALISKSYLRISCSHIRTWTSVDAMLPT